MPQDYRRADGLRRKNNLNKCVVDRRRVFKYYAVEVMALDFWANGYYLRMTIMSPEYNDGEKDKEINDQVNGTSDPDKKDENDSSGFKNIVILILCILVLIWLFIDAWKSESLWRILRFFFW